MSPLPPASPGQSHTTPNPAGPRRRATFFGRITPRTIAAPLAAFTMAILLYTYSVASIRAAKRNAVLHREADGGQLDMRRESLRRHGLADKVEGTKGLQLLRGGMAGVGGDDGERSEGRPGEKEASTRTLEQVLKEDESGKARTETEGRLEGWKGRDGSGKWKGAKVEGRILEEK